MSLPEPPPALLDAFKRAERANPEAAEELRRLRLAIEARDLAAASAASAALADTGHPLAGADVPDDVVAHVPAEGEIRLSIYGSEDVAGITMRVPDGRIPLRVGELVEFEVIAIERRVTER